MQVEEVIHNSRLYSILVRERVSGEKLGEDEDGAALAPWSTTGLISDIRSVRRTLSRKFSSLRHRRKRKKEDGGSQQQQQDTNYCDNEPSAITGDTSAAHSSKVRSSDGSRIKRHTKHHDSSNCYTTGSEDESAAEEDTATNCYGGTGGKSLSRIFGSFRHSFRHGKSDGGGGDGNPSKDPAKDTGKAADQSHEEILSGRDSAYFSLTFTSASESENEDSSHNHNNRICDESRDSIKSASLPPAPARKHQSCQTEPKKNVTLVLPDTSSPTRPYGLHLQTRTVRIRAPRHEHRLEPAGDTSWQLETIVHVAKVHLVSSFPRFRVSIDIIFSPSMKCFMSLSSSTIGDLMFHLNRILSSPRLESIVTWEVALFVVIKFLFRLVSFLTSTGACPRPLHLSCLETFHSCLLQDFCNYKTGQILRKVQQEFVQIWMCLLL